LIYCSDCDCPCESLVDSYDLPKPVIVGDCEIHHLLSSPFPSHPFVLLRGVRGLLNDCVDYTFGSVQEIFRVDPEEHMPVLECSLTDKGPFSWIASPLTLKPGTVARASLFP
jgi:hypothetical protein